MEIIDLIELKKQNIDLNEEQIDYLVYEYAIKNSIYDYQMSALLMLFNIKGMSDNEILFLTKAFIKYSDKMHFNQINNDPIIDKHSSGGVGDKVTIILLPILTALGINIPKISGRSLGHTGGTIDKLDSINVKTNLTFDEAKLIYEKNKCVIFQQTEQFVPADKKIYALRDVTATVDTIGLIVASILSKKFIMNSDYIFIDLKVGSGALVKTLDEANLLAEKMLYVANKLNRKISISLTNMDQPLGRNVGNYLEIIECIEFLNEINQAKDLKDLIYEVINEILITTKKTNSKQESFKMIDEVISSKKAFNNFKKWISDQNGDLSKIDNYLNFNSKFKIDIHAKKDGYLKIKSSKDIGMISLKLGAGRLNKETQIDFNAGIKFYKKNNDYVKTNDLIATLYSSNDINNELINEFYNQIDINNEKINTNQIIIKTMSN